MAPEGVVEEEVKMYDFSDSPITTSGMQLYHYFSIS